MALFGSLGKMLGLDSPFGKGLVTGLAEGVTREVKADMEDRKERINRIADYKIRRDQEEQERYQKEMRENLEKVRGIAGKAGGVTGAEYLIRTYGIEEAVNKAGQIETLAGFGITPSFATAEDNQTTFEDLARFVTVAPELAPTGKVKDTGLLAKIGLGADIGEAVQKQRDAATSELALGVAKMPDLGAMPTASGFDPSDLGMMSDMKDEANRQVRLAIAAKEAGNDEAYKKHMADASQMRNMLRTLDTKELTEAGGRAFNNTIAGHIESVSGVKGNHVPDGLGGFRFKATWEDAADQGKVNVAGAALTEIYAEAIQKGIRSQTAMRVIYESANSNLMPKIVEDGQGGFSIVTGDAKLIDGGFQGGTGAFAPPPPATPPAGTGGSGTGSGATGGGSSSTTPAPARVQALIDQHNATRDPRTKGRLKAQIGRIFGGSIPSNVASQLR